DLESILGFQPESDRGPGRFVPGLKTDWCKVHSPLAAHGTTYPAAGQRPRRGSPRVFRGRRGRYICRLMLLKPCHQLGNDARKLHPLLLREKTVIWRPPVAREVERQICEPAR